MSSSSDSNSPPGSASATGGRRRSSFTGQFVDLFGRSSTSGSGSAPYPGPITTAAAQAQQRRLSLTTLGLSGSPNQTSPFTPGGRPRTGSVSSSNSGTVDESPFEEGDAPSQSVPTTPFARRLSFGARAMRDIRTGSGNGNGKSRHSVSKAQKPPSPPAATASHGRGPGFDFAENMRLRAERSSISTTSGPPPNLMQQRSKSLATMETPPVREVPKQPKVPDPIQERILRGDFYMD